MKARDFLLFIFAILLVICGCREISVTTRVHRDGSFTRTIRITGDSSSVFKGDLPYPVDSTWEQVAVKDTSPGEDHRDDYILTYSKTFKSDGPLNDALSSDTSWRRKLDRRITVSKRFGFFYSYITFREVFQPTNPFTFLPLRDFLTTTDLEWLSGQKTILSPSDSGRLKDVEEKAFGYIVASATAELEQILKSGIAALNDTSLPVSEVARFHDSISAFVEQWEISNPEKLISALRRWTGNQAVDGLADLRPPFLEGFKMKAAFLDTLLLMESYPETVEMPGLITATNSTMLNGNQVSWEVQPVGLLFTEHVLTAESRVVNYWAFVILGAILILLILVFIFKAMRPARFPAN